MKHLRLPEEQLPNLDFSTLGAEYAWLANTFPNPVQTFHEIANEITAHELAEYLTGKSDNTAAGLSKLKIGLIQDLDDSGIKALLALFNACLVTGTIPSSWKKIIIVPLPKKHHITSLLETRPISLLE